MIKILKQIANEEVWHRAGLEKQPESLIDNNVWQ